MGFKMQQPTRIFWGWENIRSTGSCVGSEHKSNASVISHDLSRPKKLVKPLWAHFFSELPKCISREYYTAKYILLWFNEIFTFLPRLQYVPVTNTVANTKNIFCCMFNVFFYKCKITVRFLSLLYIVLHTLCCLTFWFVFKEWKWFQRSFGLMIFSRDFLSSVETNCCCRLFPMDWVLSDSRNPARIIGTKRPARGRVSRRGLGRTRSLEKRNSRELLPSWILLCRVAQRTHRGDFA